MKILKRYIYFTLPLLMAAGLSSCSNEDGEGLGGEDNKQPEYTYTLNFNLEDEAGMTRADNGYDGAETGIIGKGTKIDYLKFAVYDGSGNLLERFGREDYSSLTIGGKKIEAGKGQNLLKWEGTSLRINLSSMSEGEYKIVCWAQSSACDAYDTSDLSAVKVSYAGAVNNDETRDAFCASQSIYVNADGSSTVILTRPFAQINVGTSGADYKVSANTPGGGYYTYSRVQIKGAADRLDVVNGKATVSDEASNSTAIFTWSAVPAYLGGEVPVLSGTPATDEQNPMLYGDNEQYLKIDLDGDNEFLPFLTKYNTIRKNDAGKTEYLTETFKYLSMLYVLVPYTADNSDSKNTTASVLQEVKVYFSCDSEGKETNAVNSSFAISNLPVRKNWRTNILGGLYAKNYIGDQPGGTPGTDPEPSPGEDPDPDPTSLFNGVKCLIQVSPAYYDENNLTDINEFQTK